MILSTVRVNVSIEDSGSYNTEEQLEEKGKKQARAERV
jgi:hypothetical protein